MSFESEIKNGRFVIGECIKCKKINWPPHEFCSFCFSELLLRDPKSPGILIEYSIKDGKLFAIVEFEKTVRIIGTIKNTHKPEIGQKIRISSCEYHDGPVFTFDAE